MTKTQLLNSISQQMREQATIALKTGSNDKPDLVSLGKTIKHLTGREYLLSTENKPILHSAISHIKDCLSAEQSKAKRKSAFYSTLRHIELHKALDGLEIFAKTAKFKSAIY